MPQPKPTITLRRPSAPVPFAVADSFVRGEPETAAPVSAPPAGDTPGPVFETPEPPDVQTLGRPDIHPLRPGIVQRRSGRIRRRTTVYLEPSLATRLAVYCATYGLEISQIAEAAIIDYFNALDHRPQHTTEESSAAG